MTLMNYISVTADLAMFSHTHTHTHTSCELFSKRYEALLFINDKTRVGKHLRYSIRRYRRYVPFLYLICMLYLKYTSRNFY